MEQSLSNFAEKFFADNKEDQYYFVYADDGVVLCLTSDNTRESLVAVPVEISNDILEKNESLSSFTVDIFKKIITKKSKNTSIVVNNVLHKISNNCGFHSSEIDIELLYNSATKELIFSMNAIHYESVHFTNKEIQFAITDYNDPNILKQLINVQIKDLVNNTVTVMLTEEKKFSVYTNRIFNRYTITHL